MNIPPFAAGKLMAMLLCLLPLSAAVISQPVEAQERYISDLLYVPLRSGMGNQYRIIHGGLPSGTRLELLREEQTEDGEDWSLVRTQDGEEGWIRSQFLLDEPTAAMKLATLERRNRELSEQNRQWQERLNQLQNEAGETEQKLAKLRDNYQELQNAHEELQSIASDSVELHEQHQSLSENYQMLQTRFDVIQAENERLKKERRYQDWVFGGGILLAGVLLSLILQAIGKRRRHSEWG